VLAADPAASVSSASPPKAPFPRTFYVANVIELCERLGFYGMYVGLVLYLTNVVGMTDIAVGLVLGNFRLLSSLAPVPCGAAADRIGFRRSLLVAFSLYAVGYLSLFAFPSPGRAPLALACIAVAGGFMKPVITGTVVRTAPEGRQTEGFAVFYRMINAGSVIGKTLAYRVRVVVGLRHVMITSVVACLVALGLTAAAYEEPERGKAKATGLGETLRGWKDALSNARFAVFLLVFSGFYFMAEQFYMTFPKYVTRHIDAKAPLELVTLINPALIALGQGAVSRLLANVRPLTTMVLGVAIASLSMLVMGVVPGLAGACLSGAIFACAEMTFSPRFYDYVASFAPEGKAGTYMGLAFVPAAIGAWTGGQVSGPMIARYLPADGPRQPLVVWASYAALGGVCALAMLAYRRWADVPRAAPEAPRAAA
jgi:dipeptide/tripeptide permease